MSTTRVIPKNRTVYFEHQIQIITCASCSIDYGIGGDFQLRRREDHGTFYCPNGHENWYPQDNTEQRAIKERDAARELAQRESRRRAMAEQEARTAEYQRRAAKGQLTKLRKRIANGVCPCCNRSFQNVLAHMANQHPDFAVPSEALEDTR